MTAAARQPLVITDPDQVEFFNREIHRCLFDATERGCDSLDCSGASFVLMAVEYWAGEMSNIDRRGAADYFRALAAIIDARTPPHRLRIAEATRQRQFQYLCRKAAEQAKDAT